MKYLMSLLLVNLLFLLPVFGAGKCYCHPPSTHPDPCSLCPANCPCYTSTDIWNELEALSVEGTGNGGSGTCVNFNTVEFDAQNDCYCKPTNGDCDSCPAGCRCDAAATEQAQEQRSRTSRAQAVAFPADDNTSAMAYEELTRAIYFVGSAIVCLLMIIAACLTHANCRGRPRSYTYKPCMVDSSEEVGFNEKI